MKWQISASSVAVAAALLFGIAPALAQQSLEASGSVGSTDFSLQPAFPDPFDRETRIPFILGEALFPSSQRAGVEVNMRIYNLLHQPVAVARLREEDGTPGLLLDGVRLTEPGVYEAVWDGRDRQGGRLTPGPYFVQLVVGGRAQVRKLVLAR